MTPGQAVVVITGGLFIWSLPVPGQVAGLLGGACLVAVEILYEKAEAEKAEGWR